MKMKTPYAFGKTVSTSFDETEKMLRDELPKEGFGILTEIDVTQKFREKLGRSFRRYLILGACNPNLAWEAFAREIHIGTLLPCNIVLYEQEDKSTVVMVMDPVAALSLIGNPEITDIATMVRQKMERVLSLL